jgi:hypothetical protein
MQSTSIVRTAQYSVILSIYPILPWDVGCIFGGSFGLEQARSSSPTRIISMRDADDDTVRSTKYITKYLRT